MTTQASATGTPKIWYIVSGIAAAIFIGGAVVLTVFASRELSAPVATGPLNADRVAVAKLLRAACLKRKTDPALCKCGAEATARYLSDAEARKLAAAARGEANLPKALEAKLVKSGLRAGFRCGLKQAA
jgi:hypothetical protein